MIGELCLQPTKKNVAEGEFRGINLTFMGLSEQNLHNLLFRGFLRPWETYTGASLTWIDLAQAGDRISAMRQCVRVIGQQIGVLRIKPLAFGETAEAIVETPGIEIARSQLTETTLIAGIDRDGLAGNRFCLMEKRALAAGQQEPFEMQRLRNAAHGGGECRAYRDRCPERNL